MKNRGQRPIIKQNVIVKIIGRCPLFLFTGLLLASGPAYAGEPGWEQMQDENFIVYYRADVPNDFVQTTMDTAEDDFQGILDNLGITRAEGWSSKQAIIYIYSDQDDFVKNGHQALWSHGVAFAQTKTIKAYPEALGFFDSILPHELGHIIFRQFVGFSVSIPLWFEEGMAMYQEKAKRLGANKIVNKAIENGEFIPLTQLTSMRLYMDSKTDQVHLFYAESASVVYYMITELGNQRFFMLCRELKNNTPFEQALQKVYPAFKSIDDLNRAWIDDLQ